MGVRISSIFLPVDVEAIMRIRVPERIMNDQIAWHYEKSGQFSVKSAYKLALKLQSQDQMASSSNPKQSEKLCKGMPRISRRTGCKVFKVILHISLYQEVLLGHISTSQHPLLSVQQGFKTSWLKDDATFHDGFETLLFFMR